MNLARIIWWVAQQLQVHEPDRAISWLIRLFLKPPQDQPIFQVNAELIPDPIPWLAMQLHVEPNAKWQQWLLRLFVLHPNKSIMHGDPAEQSLTTLRGQLKQAITPLVWAMQMVWAAGTWPIKQLMRVLSDLALHVDTKRIAVFADRVLTPLLTQPGVRWVVFAFGALAAVAVVTTPLSSGGQFLFLILCWVCTMVLRQLPGRYPALMLATISLIAMGRYVWWRLTTTLTYDSMFEALFGTGLLLAESYTWLVVILGFIQTAWPLKRRPAVLTGDPSTWPTIDVFIPTYNEPLAVVKPTTLAAIALDWPKDKLKIFILDDGTRQEFRDFAASMGVGYIVREKHNHAKAGNLNNALKETNGNLIAIFDCDHLPVRSFLKKTVGQFQLDSNCAMVQTPHHFFSPDPFERNLGTFRRVPNEGALFYGLIQDGNDFWDATFFCGSCAVIRREPLMSIGGIAVETVTEDAHTALKLQRLGYSTAYINQTLAAGLATESLSAHIGQRIRWARGMAQILRVDNPFLGIGLNFWQRICYANAMLHFFFGLPRLVFLTSPMTYLFFELHIINAEAMLLALYVIPYILQSTIANAHVQGKYRHSFWAEVYETVLAWYVALPTTVALIKPSAGQFNVTAKGGLVKHSYFDWAISTPYTILALLNIAAILMGFLRLFIWNTHETGTVILNLVWVVYSSLLLGASIGVASEARQVRRMHRVSTRLPATLYRANGEALFCECVDFSMTGVGLQMAAIPGLDRDERIHVSLWRDHDDQAFPGHVVASSDKTVGIQFEPMTREQEIAFVQCTFARPDAWVNWNSTNDTDKPLHGLREIAMVGLQGYKKLFTSIFGSFTEFIKEHRSTQRKTAP